MAWKKLRQAARIPYLASPLLFFWDLPASECPVQTWHLGTLSCLLLYALWDWGGFWSQLRSVQYSEFWFITTIPLIFRSANSWGAAELPSESSENQPRANKWMAQPAAESTTSLPSLQQFSLCKYNHVSNKIAGVLKMCSPMHFN